MINRFRLRIRNEAAERGHVRIPGLVSSPSVLQQGHGLGQVVIDAQFPVAPPGPLASAAEQTLRVKQPGLAAGPLRDPTIEKQLRPSGAPEAGTEGPWACRVRLSLSPRLKPIRSPELRTATPDLSLEGDGLDDDEVAFPLAELDSRYETSDDVESADDVYADFGVIFGGASDGDPSDDEKEHYENAMDEMDGIPWTAR